jgi:hypothetical protein
MARWFALDMNLPHVGSMCQWNLPFLSSPSYSRRGQTKQHRRTPHQKLALVARDFGDGVDVSLPLFSSTVVALNNVVTVVVDRGPRGAPRVRMATGRVRIGWSLRAPKTKTQSRNPNPNRIPIRVEIHHQN